MKRWFSGLISQITLQVANLFRRKGRKKDKGQQKGAVSPSLFVEENPKPFSECYNRQLSPSGGFWIAISGLCLGWLLWFVLFRLGILTYTPHSHQ